MRISLKQWKIDNGIESDEELHWSLGACVYDGVAPALCDEGCEVEPDGHCSHGAPSLLLAMGMI